MDPTNTRHRLAQITDTGRFEKLATAVLRAVDSDCQRIAHVGVNEEGKTVPSPVDGIVYIWADGQRRMLAVHHTTCRRQDLRGKWLSGPESDFTKTLGELRQQRDKNPDLGATLILTTNREPTMQLVHDLETAGHDARMEIRVWVGSALADFLDLEPRGQRIRKAFLGIEPTYVSEELLRELSERSIGSTPVEDPELWVDREVVQELGHHAANRLHFVLGPSGVGKTVACLQCLQRYIQEGGFGLVVDDEVLRASLSIEEVVDRTLRKLQPTLVQGAGSEALALTSDHAELLLVVEDLNQSAEAARLAEKLAAWSSRATVDKDRRCWRILCPVWPRTMALTGDRTRETTGGSTVVITSFSEKEGIAAAKRRRPGITDLEAEAAASALGFDPLLIALHGDSDATPNPQSVIRKYIERSLDRLAASADGYTPGEYWSALRTLSVEMLKRRRLDPPFADVLESTADEPQARSMLRRILEIGEVVRLVGPIEKQHVAFRHDRVRDHLMADAIAHEIARDELPTSVISEPYFAEVIGIALTRAGTAPATIDKVAVANPLALFCALRHCSKPHADPARLVVRAAAAWAQSGAPRKPSNQTLRAAVLRVLSECDGPHIKELCETIGDGTIREWSLRGRFRNGDLDAGVQLCAMVSPGVSWAGHDELIDHVRQKGGSDFVRALKSLLGRKNLSAKQRRGALRLAGFVGSPKLASALRESWTCDSSRLSSLSDYFWASVQCCTEEPASLLRPIVDAWALMSDGEESVSVSPRVAIADELCWALQRRVPERAIGYLLKRTESRELRRLMRLMLDGVDNPQAVEFVVRTIALQVESAEMSSLFLAGAGEWSLRRRAERSPMSTASRDRLRELWLCDANGRHLRRLAFRFWCATMARGDLAVLRTIDTDGEIGSNALFERLRRGDRKAVAALVTKLEGDDPKYWWQAGRYLWTDELTTCLDRALARRADELADPACDPAGHLDWILVERLVALPPGTGERLIVQHWTGLRRSGFYVMAALHVSSPDLLKSVAEVVAEQDDPESLFEHLGSRPGLGIKGGRGLTRLSQANGLLPYLDYLSDADIKMLWFECNKNSWFDWRREHLDARATQIGKMFVDDASATRALDRDLDQDSQLFVLEHWGTSFLKTGVSLDQMMDVVARWLAQRPQEKALLKATDIVTHFGKRRHLALLDRYTAAKSPFGQKVIRNADFELRLRSLD